MKKIFFINPYKGLRNHLNNDPRFEMTEILGIDANTFVTAQLVFPYKNQTQNSDAMVVRTNCQINTEMLDLFPNCKMILRAGHGFDNIDIEECTQRKIFVFNTTGAFTDATADLTLGHILNSLRHLGKADKSMHERIWERESFTGTELSNITVGIIGLGSVGSAVAKRLISFGCEVLVYDPYKNPNSMHETKLSNVESKIYQNKTINEQIIQNIKFVELNELLSQSDVVSLHAPLTSETLYIIDKHELITMKESAILINTARGKLVKEEALYDALKSGKLKGAAIDTFSEEPATNSKLLELNNVYATPHLGSRTSASLERAKAKSISILNNALIDEDYSDALNFDFI